MKWAWCWLWILISPAIAAAQTVLPNGIIGWETRNGIALETALDESSMDATLSFVHLGLRTGYHVGLSVPVRTDIQRSPGLVAGFRFYPNPFHSRMDPFFHVRAQATREEGQFTENRPENSLLNNRPLSTLIRLQAGYGFHYNFGDYFYVQQMMGLGAGLEWYRDDTPLSRISLFVSFGVGWHGLNHLRDGKQRKSHKSG